MRGFRAAVSIALFLTFFLSGPSFSDTLSGHVSENDAAGRVDAYGNNGVSRPHTPLPFTGQGNATFSGMARQEEGPLRVERPAHESTSPANPRIKPGQLPYSSGIRAHDEQDQTSSTQWQLTVGCPHHPELQDIPIGFVGDTPEYSARFVGAWNRWSEALLHMIYANVSTFPGHVTTGNSPATIYVRKDGEIKVSGFTENSNWPSFEKSVLALQKLPQLGFPTPIQGDTVEVWVNFGYGKRSKPHSDVWGRADSEAAYPWQYRCSW